MPLFLAHNLDQPLPGGWGGGGVLRLPELLTTAGAVCPQVMWSLPGLPERFLSARASLYETAPPDAVADFATQLAKVGAALVEAKVTRLPVHPPSSTRSCGYHTECRSLPGGVKCSPAGAVVHFWRPCCCCLFW